MLFNPKWKQSKTKSKPFTLAALIAWLEKQPANKTYCYTDSGNCLIAQYLLSLGYEEVSVIPRLYQHAHSKGFLPLPKCFEQVAHGDEWTFGEALASAKAILANV